MVELWSRNEPTKISKIQGAMFVFRRDSALEIGGFSEDHLVAEDSVFSISMANHAKAKGKKFGTLFSVRVATLDRKEIKISSLPGLSWKVLKAYLGKKQSVDELGFWYDPDR